MPIAADISEKSWQSNHQNAFCFDDGSPRLQNGFGLPKYISRETCNPRRASSPTIGSFKACGPGLGWVILDTEYMI